MYFVARIIWKGLIKLHVERFSYLHPEFFDVPLLHPLMKIGLIYKLEKIDIPDDFFYLL
jgi:hypothetical protein